LHRAHTGGGNIAVLGLKFLGMGRHILQHRLQVLEIEQQQTLVISNLEDGGQHPGLGVIEIQQAGEKQGAHIRDRGADRMSLLPEDIPERHRATGKRKIRQVELFYPIGDLGVVDPRLADTREVALHIRGKDRDANPAERLCHHLQGYRLAGAGRSGDQPMTIGHGRKQVERLFALGNQQGFGHIRGFYRRASGGK